VVGTSGSGKSSLVNCGLRPALHRGLMASAGTAFLLGMIAAGAQLAWQIATLNIDDAENCLTRFRSNRDFGLIVLAAILLDMALAAVF